MSLERGDQAAAVLLQLQDSHLARLVPYEGVSGLHIKPGIRLRSKKKKLCPAEKKQLQTKREKSNCNFNAKTELHSLAQSNLWVSKLYNVSNVRQ